MAEMKKVKIKIPFEGVLKKMPNITILALLEIVEITFDYIKIRGMFKILDEHFVCSVSTLKFRSSETVNFSLICCKPQHNIAA